MASPAEIFNKLIFTSGVGITVKTGTFHNHHVLRTRLCKYFSDHKSCLQILGESSINKIPLADLGICATYSTQSHQSTFRIGVPKNRSNLDYEIVDSTVSPPHKC